MAVRIILKQKDFERMTEWAKKHLPEEACGLIGGTETLLDDGTLVRKIEHVSFLTNVDHTSEHFSLDPSEQLKDVKAMRSENLKLFGNWHSHPSTPSRQSDEDIRLSFNHEYNYLILSLMEKDRPVIHSFHCENGISTKEELIIEK